ncbi:MAG: hypothetical protein HQK49_06920 [Oligoflexia bacterium]|nr:hypothetical protein [Oligoflexia bacterium]
MKNNSILIHKILFIIFFSFLFSFLFLFNGPAEAQYAEMAAPDLDEDDLNISGDIFSDFNEDLEASQVLEDERFYRFGRFYSFSTAAGVTTYTGNRGNAYEDKHPSLGVSLFYFLNFRMAFGLGVEYSKHYMLIDVPTKAFDQPGGPGAVEVNMFRTFFFYRYYIDTAELGTAMTYANPFFSTRIEFWDQTDKFIDHADIPNASGGAIGAAFGIGLEFPIKFKESYLGVEALYHIVNFKDTYTQMYRPKDGEDGGYTDLTGNVMTTFISYVISW